MPTRDISLEAFRTYLLGVKQPSTAQKYTESVARFLKLMRDNGYTNFAELPPGLLSEFGSMLSNQGCSASTVRVYVFAAKKYLEWVQSLGVEVARQGRPELPRRHLTHRPVLPVAKFGDYFRQADIDLKEPLRTAAMLLPCCGLRADEMVSLKLSSIHRADVKLRNGKTRTTLFLRIVGKGGKERNVPLMEEGVEILTGYLSGWRSKQKGPWVFPSLVEDIKGSKHISDRSLRGALAKMRVPLGIAFTPHTMRRTYITMLWRRGVDMLVIAKIAGHANVQTTIDHYIVLDPTESIQAVHDAGNTLT